MKALYTMHYMYSVYVSHESLINIQQSPERCGLVFPLIMVT
jgi:hypothetical protein